MTEPIIRKSCRVTIKDRIRLSQEKNFPAEIHIEPTNYCNKACYMCPMKDRYKKDIFPLGYMDWDLYKGLIDEASAVHGENLTLNLHKDGEPLMHPRIGDMIKYAKDKGAFVHFATNGILLRKKKEELVNSGLDLLTLSTIDDSVLTIVKDFMDYKGDRDPFLQVKLFDKSGGGGKERLGKIVMAGAPMLKFAPSYDPMNKWRAVGVDGWYTFAGWHKWTDADEFTKKAPCTKILYSMAVTWEGILNSCCLDYRRDMPLGLFPQETIRRGWERLQRVHKNQHKGIWIKPCTSCDFYQRLSDDETKLVASWTE